jgi:hypothetical protein
MKKKAKKEFGEATRASIMKEMAKPRMAKSAREEEANRGARVMQAIANPSNIKSKRKSTQKRAFDAQAFSIRPGWREKLWNIEAHRRSTLKVNPPRV